MAVQPYSKMIRIRAPTSVETTKTIDHENQNNNNNYSGDKSPSGKANKSNGEEAVKKRTRHSVSANSVRAALHLTASCGWRPRIRKYLRRVFLSLMFLGYIVVPLCYRHCTWVRRNIIYLNAFNSVPMDDLLDPVKTGGFSCARNFYFHPEPDIRLGIWHIMPEISSSSRCSLNGTILDTGDNEFNDGRPIIFHLHGSAGARGSGNRIDLINILTKAPINAHVLTFDYRGFGDSTQVNPSVESVTRDVIALYRWLRIEKNVDNKRIIFYGQSLGTGIAMHLAHAVQDRFTKGKDDRLIKLGGPAGIILEAPYTDIAEASDLHPYTVFHTYFPWKQDCFVTPIRHSDTFWDSQSRIGNISAPVLILHAEDDDIIPYVLGKKLYEVGLANRDPIRQPTRMVTYKASLGYGHLAVCTDPEIPALFNNFITEFSK